MFIRVQLKIHLLQLSLSRTAKIRGELHRGFARGHPVQEEREPDRQSDGDQVCCPIAPLARRNASSDPGTAPNGYNMIQLSQTNRHKAKARRLRDILAAQKIDNRHSNALQLIAELNGAHNWNTLIA